MSGKPIAVISGGSSGIGLAAAGSLLRRGYAVVLAARSEVGLARARAHLQAQIAGVLPGDIATCVLDVRDTQACHALIDQLEQGARPVDFLLTSAGLAEPGSFLEQPLDRHAEQMAINYFGTLALVHAAAGRMTARKRGRIVLVGSGAGFVGIYGYSAYAPSKFAVRGLAETLRAELAEHGVTVSLACPPDTDTPQYQAEQAMKPAVTKAVSAGGGLFSAEAVGEKIVRQALAGRFVITHGWPLFLLRWAHSFYGPLFIRGQQALARKLRKTGAGDW